jgi:ATP-binding cassette subfamily B protein
VRHGFRLAAGACRQIAASAGRLVAARLVLALAVGTTAPAGAWLTRLLLDRLTGRGGPDPHLLVGWIALTGAAVGVLPPVAQYLDAEIARRCSRRCAAELADALARQSGLRRLEDPGFLDRLGMARQAGGGAIAQLATGLIGAAQAAVTAIGLLLALATFAPGVAAVVGCCAVPGFAVQTAVARRQERAVVRSARPARRYGLFNAMLVDPRVAKECRLYGLSGFLRTRMLHAYDALLAEQRGADRAARTANVLLAGLMAAVAGGALLITVDGVLRGGGVGNLVVLTAALVGVQGAVSTVVAQLGNLHKQVRLFEHYRVVVETPDDLPSPPRARDLPPLRIGIELRDVWFRYHDRAPWALAGVSLTVPAGSSLAVVGLNGAGKSTLMKLLCRLYDPQRGQVLWDGVDLRDLDPAQLRARVSAVFQDFMSYELTARENIAVGDLSAAQDHARIETAARWAGADAFLCALPEGYDTFLSRMFAADHAAAGTVLSGGQWQRVAIARAALRQDACLVLLDEPSSGLDPEAEHEILARFADHRAGRTSVLISHRLGGVRDADSIVVLDGGKVAERGDHVSLMAAGGRYAELFRLQAGAYA